MITLYEALAMLLNGEGTNEDIEHLVKQLQDSDNLVFNLLLIKAFCTAALEAQKEKNT